jgi:hypothetical protein
MAARALALEARYLDEAVHETCITSSRGLASAEEGSPASPLSG